MSLTPTKEDKAYSKGFQDGKEQMEIEEKGELTKFETMPTEGTLYLTAVRYPPSSWMQGPSGMDKGQVIAALTAWTGIDKARIYAVKVPLDGPVA